MRHLRTHSTLILSLSSGWLLGISFVLPSFGWLSWFALVPCLIALDVENDPVKRWRNTYLTFLACYLVAGYWVLRHAVVAAAITSLPGLLTLPLLHAIPFLAAGALSRRFGKRIGFLALLSFVSAFEFALEHGQWGLPWILLGHSQSGMTATNQIADVIGTPGLTWWILALNAFSREALTAGRRIVRITGLAGIVVLLSSALLYSFVRTSSLDAGLEKWTIRMVQPGIHPKIWDTYTNQKRLGILQNLTYQDPNLDTVDLVVWPETSLYLDSDSLAGLRGLGPSPNTALALGAVVSESGADKDDRIYNSLLVQQHDSLERYDKYRLVPFGEGVPYAESFPWLSTFTVASGGATGYSRGSPPVPLDLMGIRVGGLICFESAFSGLAASLVRQGAQVLLVVSQDGWWSDPLPATQHVAVARMRAIETRRSVIHLAATGPSAVIDPIGNISTLTPWMQAQTHDTQVVLTALPAVYPLINTFSSLIGPIVSVFLVFLWFFRRPLTRRKQTRETHT